MSGKRRMIAMKNTIQRFTFVFPDVLLEKNSSRFLNVAIFFSASILLIGLIEYNKMKNKIKSITEEISEDPNNPNIFILPIFNKIVNKILEFLIWNFFF